MSNSWSRSLMLPTHPQTANCCTLCVVIAGPQREVFLGYLLVRRCDWNWIFGGPTHFQCSLYARCDGGAFHSLASA
eukprot:1128438-Amphidinium_carterae.1